MSCLVTCQVLILYMLTIFDSFKPVLQACQNQNLSDQIKRGLSASCSSMCGGKATRADGTERDVHLVPTLPPLHLSDLLSSRGFPLPRRAPKTRRVWYAWKPTTVMQVNVLSYLILHLHQQDPPKLHVDLWWHPGSNLQLSSPD